MNSKQSVKPITSAKEFWKSKFDEYPQSDAEKLAVAMMQEYAEQFKAHDEEKTGSLVHRFGEVVAEKQKYKELYEQECKNHYFTRLGWESTCDERDKLKAQEQKPVTDEEIEKFGEKKYPILWKDMSQHKHEIFIKGFKAALKPNGNPNLIDALTKINQMSDCGSPEATIIRMKEIASEALKLK